MSKSEEDESHGPISRRCRELEYGFGEDDEEYFEQCSCLRNRWIISPVCCYCQLFCSIPFLVIAVIGTQLWQRFTPVYREVEFGFGGPQINGKHFSVVDMTRHMSVPMAFDNPNPYPIEIHEKRGKILLAHSWHELGQFVIPSAFVPPQSHANFSVESEVAIDGVGDILAVTPELLAHLVEFWFVVEDLEGEARIDLFAQRVNITIKLSRACSAVFNTQNHTTDGDMFCSENRTQLEKRVPAPPLVFPELTDKYEAIKNRAVGIMMVLGYCAGGLLLFFASFIYQSLPETLYIDECLPTTNDRDRLSSIESVVLIS